MSVPRVAVILVSVREGRAGERVARWFVSEAEADKGLAFELVDLKDWALPPYAYPKKPSLFEHEYPDALPKRWVALVEGFDGFVVVTPEYNYGYPAQLKNVMDYAVDGWQRKPLGVVSYGGISGGLRSAEKLRAAATAYGLVPISAEIAFPQVSASFPEGARVPVDPKYRERAQKFIGELAWWVRTLSQARNAVQKGDAV